MFSYISAEQRVPQGHPLRALRALVEPVLKELSPGFDALYARGGRPSIAPEKLLRALLLQVLYTVRSELMMEQFDPCRRQTSGVFAPASCRRDLLIRELAHLGHPGTLTCCEYSNLHSATMAVRNITNSSSPGASLRPEASSVRTISVESLKMAGTSASVVQ
jgi:hypothetical protein